jgi:type IV secretion/conjugal transfer VirB4 family ATPase
MHPVPALPVLIPESLNKMLMLSDNIQSLKPYHDKSAGVGDLLNYAVYRDDGIVGLKDGSQVAAFEIFPPDTASSTNAMRNHTASRVNSAASRFGKGVATWTEAVRFPSSKYPAKARSFFINGINRMIDDERRQQFEEEGNHFESYYLFIVVYTPPSLKESQFAELMYESESTEEDRTGERVIENFKKILVEIQNSLQDELKLRQLKSYTFVDSYGQEHMRDELVNYLHFAITGLDHPINIPPVPMFMSNYIGGQELWVGDTPKIGENFFQVVALEGFPTESYPNMLNMLESLPIAYRWSSRMLYLDQHESVKELKRFRRMWRQKAKGFFSQVFKTSGGMVNEDAVTMANQAESAITDANSALVNFGYYTPVIILMGPDKKVLQENARTIIREVQRFGFTCRLETINTVEAWLGSLPGHTHANVRRSLIHTRNWADLQPLTSTWTGKEFCPCDKYPANSPPLFYAASTGATPFRGNFHVGDVGHTLMVGPTGAGKSTGGCCFFASQFQRYPGATVFAFDKGNSMWALANATGGRHYDIGSDTTPHFAPLAVLDTNSDLAWAEEWIATCFQLQTEKAPSPRQREAIHRAMVLFKENAPPEHRSLTDFLSTVQDQEIRSALAYYTIDGALGHLLDSATDGLQDDAFTVLEIEELMGMGEKSAIPVLLYLFRRFDKTLKGQPALLVLDEAWIMLGHPVFREKIREWLKVLRKSNCAVFMATQSLTDGSVNNFV